MLGGTAITACVPSVLENDRVTCSFGEVDLAGVYVTDREVLCVSPDFLAPGTIALQIRIIRGGEVIFQGEKPFYACK